MSGVRVVEAGRFASAPSCGTILADWGAEVIKLEPPQGDPARGPGSLTADGHTAVNPRFDVHNRSRRSVALDLALPRGREVAQQLIGQADVFVTNLRPSALTRLGLDSETLRGGNPRLVYGQVTGYGAGEAEDRRSYDHGAFWSYSGMADLFQDGTGQPPQPAGGMGDRATGSALAGAVAGALFARERTGRGEHVSVSLLRTAMWLMASDVADALRHPDSVRETARAAAPIPTVNCYRCADGRWLWLQLMLPNRDWSALLDALDAHWLDEDPRFRGGDPKLLGRWRAELVESLDEVFRRRPLHEWEERLAAAGLTFAPVQGLADAVGSPLVDSSGAFLSISNGSGSYRTVNSPATFASSGSPVGTSSPAVGADTADVLAEIGLDADAQDALVAEGVFHPSPAGAVTPA